MYILHDLILHCTYCNARRIKDGDDNDDSSDEKGMHVDLVEVDLVEVEIEVGMRDRECVHTQERREKKERRIIRYIAQEKRR